MDDVQKDRLKQTKFFNFFFSFKCVLIEKVAFCHDRVAQWTRRWTSNPKNAGTNPATIIENNWIDWEFELFLLIYCPISSSQDKIWENVYIALFATNKFFIYKVLFFQTNIKKY